LRLIPFVAVVFLATISIAADSDPVADAAARLETLSAKLQPELGAEFRLLGAESLRQERLQLAQKLVAKSVESLRSDKEVPSPPVVRLLAAAAPDESVALIPAIAPGSAATAVSALAQAGHLRQALALYRDASAKKLMAPAAAAPLLGVMIRQKAPEAEQLARETLAAFSFQTLQPGDVLGAANLIGSAAQVALEAAVDAADRLLAAVAVPEFGENAKLTATFQIAQRTITTNTARDAALVIAGNRLINTAPGRFPKYRDLLDRWDLAGTLQVRSLNAGTTTSAPAADSRAAEAAAIRQRIGQFRGMATDADRAKAALEVVASIRALSEGTQKLSLAMSLSNLATEGNLGKEALTAVAAALGESIRFGGSSEYVQLAKYVRYERVAAPVKDVALDAADALLGLRESLQLGKTFSLTAMDGKTYSLAGLRGKVVLLNFWATWCPPCRKEMPDMEKLYREYQKDGFVVLAVSDEDRETVAGFLAKQNYTFPVLLDADRKVHESFDVEGIPKSFLFGRDGRIVARTIDMRTEPQFREMLALTGIK
jgi:peroxiredoxin